MEGRVRDDVAFSLPRMLGVGIQQAVDAHTEESVGSQRQNE